MTPTDPTPAPEAPPAVRMYEMLYGSITSQLLIVVAELGVADHLVDGPRPVAELAADVDAHPCALYRALRALASVGVFTEVAPRVFGPTPLADTLRSDAPGSLRDLARYVGLPARQAAFAGLGHSVRTGRPAFDFVHGTDWWTWFRAHPELSTLFNGAMGAMARSVNGVALDGLDLARTRKVVDVGGGQGHLVARLLRSWPRLRGVVFDLPHVVPEAEKVLAAEGPDVADRAECVAGSFLEEVPAGGDLYVLSWTIHDWDDDDAVTILRNVARAMGPAGTLLVIDEVLQPGDDPHFGKFEDIVMLALLTGRVRTEAEFVALFDAAGLRLAEVLPTAAPTSVIVVKAV